MKYQRKKALNERLSSCSLRITSWLVQQEQLVRLEQQQEQQERLQLEQQQEQRRQLVLHQQLEQQQEQQEQQLA